jgi:DNA-binding HxlR family transcriptional regulator
MAGDKEANELMRIFIQVVARATCPLASVRDVVGDKPAYVRAFNLCDGTRGQSEIVKKVGLDQGNFSRALQRWIDAGVVFRIGEGDSTLLHVYPVEPIAKRSRKAVTGAKTATTRKRRAT